MLDTRLSMSLILTTTLIFLTWGITGVLSPERTGDLRVRGDHIINP